MLTQTHALKRIRLALLALTAAIGAVVGASYPLRFALWLMVLLTVMATVVGLRSRISEDALSVIRGLSLLILLPLLILLCPHPFAWSSLLVATLLIPLTLPRDALAGALPVIAAGLCATAISTPDSFWTATISLVAATLIAARLFPLLLRSEQHAFATRSETERIRGELKARKESLSSALVAHHQRARSIARFNALIQGRGSRAKELDRELEALREGGLQ